MLGQVRSGFDSISLVMSGYFWLGCVRSGYVK